MPSGTMSLEMIFAGIATAIQTENFYETFLGTFMHADRYGLACQHFCKSKRRRLTPV